MQIVRGLMMNRVHAYSVLTFMPWHKKMWSETPPPHLDLHLDAHCRRRLAALQSPPLALASPACSDVEDAEPLLADLHQMNRSEYY